MSAIRLNYEMRFETLHICSTSVSDSDKEVRNVQLGTTWRHQKQRRGQNFGWKWGLQLCHNEIIQTGEK